MWVLLGLAACPSEDEACAAAAEDPQMVTLGTGETEFAAVEEDDALPLTYGSQGGAHVWGSLRVSGIVQGISDSAADEDNPLVTYVIKDGDTEIAGFHSVRHHFRVNLDGTWEFLGDRLVLYDWSWGSSVDTDIPYTLEAEVNDVCGTVLTQSTTINLKE